MRIFFRNNGLSLVVLALFLLSWIGQLLTGHRVYNDDLVEHARDEVSLREYLGSGHFLEATAENWESEFLQMAMYVTLTVFLYQKGSSESKTPDEPAAVDRDPRLAQDKKDAPWPVRRGGIWLRLYEHSLSLAFVALFVGSSVGHLLGGRLVHNELAVAHGEDALSVLGYFTSSQFWFESFQNWQSEFLSIAAMVILSVFLRERGSPESKPVDSPHAETGD